MRGGEIKEEGEEEKDGGKGGPSTCPGPKWGPAIPPDSPSVVSHTLPSAPPLGPSLRRLPHALAAREQAFSPLSPFTSAPRKWDGQAGTYLPGFMAGLEVVPVPGS